MTEGEGRKDFLDSVRKSVARKAMYVCSNPGCLRVTGFSTSKGKARAIAQAAHVVAAADSGPRADDVIDLPDGSTLQRDDEGNAIWLCMPCHYRVDADEEEFPSDLLLAWKRDHEKRISDLVGLDLEQSLLRLGEVRVSHDLARDLLAWLDGHRFMYFEDSQEQPDYVWKAVDALRIKLVDLRGRVVSSESAFGIVLAAIDDAVHEFVVSLNHIRVDEIQVSSGVASFEEFARALRRMRSRILAAAAPLAKREEYKFTRIPQYLLEESGADGVEFGSGLASAGKK